MKNDDLMRTTFLLEKNGLNETDGVVMKGGGLLVRGGVGAPGAGVMSFWYLSNFGCNLKWA